MAQLPCKHITDLDPRCFPSRLTSLLIEDVIYYCGTYPERCPHYQAIERELGNGSPAGRVQAAGA